MKVQNKIAYFIDFSIQEIPSIVFIAYETGGTIYTDSELTYRFIRNDHPKLKILCFKTVTEIRNHMESSGVKVVIYPDYHIHLFKDLPDARHIQVFHGTSDKVYDYRKDVLEYDLFFIPGEHAYKRYEKRGLLKRNNGVLIGYPKLDRVFRGELQRNEELIKLGMNPDNKTILYAPTWVDKSANSSWKKFRTELTGGKPENINLIVKLHPNLIRYRKAEVDELRDQLRLTAEALLLDVLPDIVPVMAASDILVSDVSAVTREYLAFKRPLIFLSNKPAWAWRRRKTDIWDCGKVITKPYKIWPAIAETLQYPNEYNERILQQLHKTFYRPDGNAARRAKKAIFDILQDQDTPKPLI
jgi:CDP-glycerol glycerophosphotransferase (TagB/SpsB family)